MFTVLLTAAVYAQVVGLLLTVFALGLERLVGMWQWRHRDVWTLTLVASIMIPAVLAYRAFHAATNSEWLSSPHSSFVAAVLDPGALIVWARMFIPEGTENWFGWLWLASSIGFVVCQIWEFRRLSVAARGWQPLRIDGTSVLLSDNVGPAAIGFFRPKIVVPRWLLAADPDTRIAAIAHEREHIEKRDQLLATFGLVVLSAMPWNIALSFQFERLCLSIETDCDGRVVSSEVIDRRIYAGALLALWRRTNARASFLSLPQRSSPIKYRLELLRRRESLARLQ
jgi:beta-lactamase regulating signal transducer with metallopeptidase domain